MTDGARIASRYRVIECIGRGAFATAYRCEDTEAGGEVVLKLYQLGERGWSMVTSFEREVAVLAALSHPAIPRYLDHAQLPDGRLMLVETYAPGRTLAELLREGKRFTDHEIFDFAEQILRVLEYLQSLNPPIVHRDVKPGNLVLGADGQITLVDFGSVKAEFRRDVDMASTTVGTYGYMAPEQFQGRASIRSDLYGLGATLVHLLSHIAPADLPQDGLQLDFHDSVKAGSSTLAWLDRMLQADPRQRFASAKEALVAFRRRDAAPLVAVPRHPTLDRSGLPPWSRIVAEHRPNGLYLMVPGDGFGGVGMLAGVIVGLVFGAAWIYGALRTGWAVLVATTLIICVITGWGTFQALFATFGVTTIRLGPERYLIRRRLFGFERRVEGATKHLDGAAIVCGGKGRSRRSFGCVLYTGVTGVRFGGHLGTVERRWLVDVINERLGIEGRERDE